MKTQRASTPRSRCNGANAPPTSTPPAESALNSFGSVAADLLLSRAYRLRTMHKSLLPWRSGRRLEPRIQSQPHWRRSGSSTCKASVGGLAPILFGSTSSQEIATTAAAPVIRPSYVCACPTLCGQVRRIGVHAVLASASTSSVQPCRDWLHFGYIGPPWALISALSQPKRKAPQL